MVKIRGVFRREFAFKMWGSSRRHFEISWNAWAVLSLGSKTLPITLWYLLITVGIFGVSFWGAIEGRSISMALIEFGGTVHLNDQWICRVDDVLHSQKMQAFPTTLQLFHQDPWNCVAIEVCYDQLLLWNLTKQIVAKMTCKSHER